jgi:hypothetical protein
MFDDVDPIENPHYVISKKQWCIEEQEGKGKDDRCWTEFWLKNMNVWDHIQQNKESPTVVMAEFADWYRDLTTKYTGLKLVMKPASYDHQWINALYDQYGPAGKPTLPFSNICISTIFSVMDVLRVDSKKLKELVKCPDVSHTHFADDDAHEQGYTYLRLKTLLRTGKYLELIKK